jgi:hypothetical protein
MIGSMQGRRLTLYLLYSSCKLYAFRSRVCVWFVVTEFFEFHISTEENTSAF